MSQALNVNQRWKLSPSLSIPAHLCSSLSVKVLESIARRNDDSSVNGATHFHSTLFKTRDILPIGSLPFFTAAATCSCDQSQHNTTSDKLFFVATFSGLRYLSH